MPRKATLIKGQKGGPENTWTLFLLYDKEPILQPQPHYVSARSPSDKPSSYRMSFY